jgi:hypothetical protein
MLSQFWFPLRFWKVLVRITHRNAPVGSPPRYCCVGRAIPISQSAEPWDCRRKVERELWPCSTIFRGLLHVHLFPLWIPVCHYTIFLLSYGCCLPTERNSFGVLLPPATWPIFTWHFADLFVIHDMSVAVPVTAPLRMRWNSSLCYFVPLSFGMWRHITHWMQQWHN